jgi:hypothetical protein
MEIEMKRKGKSNPESVNERVERCALIIDKSYENLRSAIGIATMLDRANSPEIHAQFNRTYEAHGMSLIHHTLMAQLITTLMRMYDSARGEDRISSAVIRITTGQSGRAGLFR